MSFFVTPGAWHLFCNLFSCLATLYHHIRFRINSLVTIFTFNHYCLTDIDRLVFFSDLLFLFPAIFCYFGKEKRFYRFCRSFVIFMEVFCHRTIISPHLGLFKLWLVIMFLLRSIHRQRISEPSIWATTRSQPSISRDANCPH